MTRGTDKNVIAGFISPSILRLKKIKFTRVFLNKEDELLLHELFASGYNLSPDSGFSPTSSGLLLMMLLPGGLGYACSSIALCVCK